MTLKQDLHGRSENDSYKNNQVLKKSNFIPDKMQFQLWKLLLKAIGTQSSSKLVWAISVMTFSDVIKQMESVLWGLCTENA